MSAVKFIVIGLGSMGKRRIRILKKHFQDVSVCGADTAEERRRQIQERFGIPVYTDYRTAIAEEKPTAAVVCTSPLSHAEITMSCLNAGLSVFSEINLLADDYDAILNAARQRKANLFLSSTLLYRRDIDAITGIAAAQKSRVNYRYHVGQYLPDWHPWENYRDFFVSDRRTNACREIFAIQLPWLLKAFGEVENITVLKDKMSALAIDYPDNYFVLFQHRNGNRGVMIVDIVSRKPVTNLLVYSENLHLMWDGTPESLIRYQIREKRTETVKTYDEIETDGRYSEKIIENAYMEELRAFIRKLSGEPSSERYTFEDDRDTLRLIDRIEGIRP